MDGQQDVDVLDDLLLRFVTVEPPELGAHDRVAIGHPLPRCVHGVDVHVLGEHADELLDVDADVGALQVVEKHPLLDRRERVCVDNWRTGHGLTVTSGLPGDLKTSALGR